jgi:hypothetical protein
MREFKTRSSLLSIVDRLARVISAQKQGPDIEALLDLCVDPPACLGLSRYELVHALSALLHALKEEAALSPFGWLVARWDIETRLSNLRRLRQEEMHLSGIVEESIVAPIIITGSPRSGTTFLQSLLAQDPQNQVLRCWQAVYPYRASSHVRWRGPRPSRMGRQLRYFNLLAPDLHKVHPLNGCSPQECTEIMAHVFHSLRFDSIYHVPSYRRWLDSREHLSAYRFHKRFLQHLQHQNGRQRWVLKSPDHVFALDTISSIYPDACFVFMHRDPIKVLPSNAQLIELLRAPFTHEIDCMKIGRQVMADLALGAATMIETSRLDTFPSDRVFHLHFSDLISRPLDAIRRLYRHFGLSVSEAATDRIAHTIAAQSKGGYAQNSYRLERHGIDPDEVEARFGDYMSYFDIAPEAVAPRFKGRRES